VQEIITRSEVALIPPEPLDIPPLPAVSVVPTTVLHEDIAENVSILFEANDEDEPRDSEAKTDAVSNVFVMFIVTIPL